MRNTVYMLKVDPRGRLALPSELRERAHLEPGAHVMVTVTDEGTLQIYGRPIITEHFGAFPDVWTNGEQDAAEYSREARNSMQPKIKQLP